MSQQLQKLVIREESSLPPNKQWENRFEIRSETSGRVYIVSQNIEKRHWGCSCPAWRIHRRCKHLQALRLPGGCQPHEVIVEKQ